MRNLAHIETVHNIRPIEGADRIEQVSVLGWNLIARKGEFQEGDKAVYIEIDSLVPRENPAFAFLEPKRFKIKTMKMRGVVSQGIALPLSILPAGEYAVGQDVTEVLGIEKIPDETEESLAAGPSKKHGWLYRKLLRYAWFRALLRAAKKRGRRRPGYPDWVRKTDEPRIQNIPHLLARKEPMTVTEKLDGSSLGVTLRGRDFFILSRNVIKGENGGSNFSRAAGQIHARAVLKALKKRFGANYVTIQGEMIGEGIQGNKYGLKGLDFRAFNLIVDGQKLGSAEAAELLEPYGIQWAPILAVDYVLPDTVGELMEYVTGPSALADTPREGCVFRNAENTVSFKCVSEAFLLKWGL